MYNVCWIFHSFRSLWDWKHRQRNFDFSRNLKPKKIQSKFVCWLSFGFFFFCWFLLSKYLHIIAMKDPCSINETCKESIFSLLEGKRWKLTEATKVILNLTIFNIIRCVAGMNDSSTKHPDVQSIIFFQNFLQNSLQKLLS